MDFLGDPMVKTPCLQCRGCKFDSWSGNWDPLCCGAKKRKKKKKKKSTIRERRGQIKDNDCFESGLFLVDLEGVLGLFFSEGIRVLNRLVAW